MNLKENSWHARWYLCNHRFLPTSLCPYFWSLVILAIKFPFCWIGYLIPGMRGRGDDPGSRFVVTFVTYLVLVLGWSIAEQVGYTESFWEGLLYSVLYGIGVVMAISLFVAIIYGGIELYGYIRRRILNNSWGDEPPKEYIVVEWWKGFKDNYCPRINWK